MRKYGSALVFCVFLVAVCVAQVSARTKGKAVIAVIQADGSPRQDAFKASYDFTSVEPMSRAHLDKLLDLLEQAGRMGADLVCGPEDMQNIGAYGLYLNTKHPQTGETLFTSLAVPVPGALTDRLADIARRHGMYIIAPLYERQGDKVFNTSVVFDRKGEIIGIHRKTVLPVLETWLVTPGDEYKVFELDFGTIAIATCWEIVFPEVSTILTLKGADIIFNPTMGRENKPGESLATGHRYLTRAVDNRVYIAPVILGSDGNGIIDFNGKVVAEAVGEKNTVITAEIDFSAEPLGEGHWWPTINGTADEKAIHYLSRRPETFKLLVDPAPPLLERFRKVELTTGNRQAQLKALKEVDYGP